MVWLVWSDDLIFFGSIVTGGRDVGGEATIRREVNDCEPNE